MHTLMFLNGFKKNMAGSATCLVASLLFGLAGWPADAHAQSSDVTQASEEAYSLTLSELFNSAIATHPSLLAARLQVKAAAHDVTAVERQWWPSLSLMYEDVVGKNNVNTGAQRLLRVEQTLWDAGRNNARIAEAETRTRLTQEQVQSQQQELFIQIIAGWQNLLASTERKAAAQESLDLLRGYRQQIERRVEAQISPRIDLELADARILQTEVDLATAQNAMQMSITRLEQLSSLQNLALRLTHLPPLPATARLGAFTKALQQADWQHIANQNNMVEKARLERQRLADQYSAKQAERWPQFYARLDQPIGSGNPSVSTKPFLYAGLRYAPGAGFSSVVEANAMATRIESQDQSVEEAYRGVLQTLLNDRDEFISARSRVSVLEKTVEGSRIVLDSYLRQFQGGRKSWQDLLNTAREQVQNQYALADARATLVGAFHRLELRANLGALQP